MGVVGHRAGHDLGGVGAGEPEELVDLVAGDVGEDAAGPVPVVEPVGPALAAGEMGAVALAVGAEAQGLHDPADPTGADQLAGLDRAAHLEPLGERHRPEPAGLRDRLLHRRPARSRLMQPGLSATTSLPLRSAVDGDRTARRSGTAAVTIRSIVGSRSRSLPSASLHRSIGPPARGRPARPPQSGSSELETDELATLAEQTRGSARRRVRGPGRRPRTVSAGRICSVWSPLISPSSRDWECSPQSDRSLSALCRYGSYRSLSCQQARPRDVSRGTDDAEAGDHLRGGRRWPASPTRPSRATSAQRRRTEAGHGGEGAKRRSRS